jgi:hypothetical protein
MTTTMILPPGIVDAASAMALGTEEGQIIARLIDDLSPSTRLECYALADLYDERDAGASNVSFCLRWMGYHDVRPARRDRSRSVSKPFIWYCRGCSSSLTDRRDLDLYDTRPMSLLDPSLFRAIVGVDNQAALAIYLSWSSAVTGLANALRHLRLLLSVSPGRY